MYQYLGNSVVRNRSRDADNAQRTTSVPRREESRFAETAGLQTMITEAMSGDNTLGSGNSVCDVLCFTRLDEKNASGV